MTYVRGVGLVLTLAAIACSADGPVEPRPAQDRPYPPLYAKAIRSTEFLIADVKARASQAPVRSRAAYDAFIRKLESRLAELKRSARTAPADAGPLFLQEPCDGEESCDGGGSEAEQVGIIDRDNTWTRVFLRGGPPVIYVQTVVTWPATSITHATGGTTRTRGREYGINASWTDFGWDAFQTINLDNEVDCSKYGAKVDAWTWHQAKWAVKGVEASAEGYRSTGNDNGECPPVPPTAKFTMSGGGQSASEGEILAIKVPQGGSAGVTLDGSPTTFDGPVTLYSWYINGNLIGTGPAIGYTVNANHVGVSLIVKDANNLTDEASGTIALDYQGEEESCEDDEGDVMSVSPASPLSFWKSTTLAPSWLTPAASASECPDPTPPPGGGPTGDNVGPVDVPSGTGDVWYVCEKTNWYVSHDGGQTWRWTHTTYDNCYLDIM